MYSFSAQQKNKALLYLVIFHIVVIATSNYLVQFPFTIYLIHHYPLHSTWGALSFPFIFLATDLTVRIFGQALARKIIFCVMIPALLLSYILSMWFQNGVWQRSFDLAWTWNETVFRIALASFTAYVLGQLLDIFVFNRLRLLKSWWIAPTASTFIGNALDTLVFFAIAFYQSNDEFMATNWIQIAWLDYLFKLAICTAFFLPAYGLLLNFLIKKLTRVQ